MPAAYAHHRFGDACIAMMPEKLQRICEANRELFDFGVHGPDLLFYYNPLNSNKVNRHGSELHTWTGAQVFEIGKYVYQGMDGQLAMTAPEKYAFLAYLLGFLAHFTLDSSAHGYINQMTSESSYSHNLIESQYEAFLMRKDGKDPLKVDRSAALKANAGNAAVIAKLFPFSEKEVLASMWGQKLVLRLFYSPREIVKKLVRKLIGVLGMSGDFGDLFLDEEILPECDGFNETIYQCQKKAEERYPALLRSFIAYLKDQAALDIYFNHDFEGEPHE